MLFRTLLILIILFLLDLYIFNGLRYLVRNHSPLVTKSLSILFWLVSAFCYSIIVGGMIVDWHDWPKPFRTYSFAFIFVTYFSKIFFVVFLFIDDFFRLVRWFIKFASASKVDATGEPVVKKEISRSDFIVKTGLFIAAIPFTALIMGMLRGKYSYQVRNVKLSLDKLPASFRGFRIVQISDIHTGSFMSHEPLEKAVKMINDLKPDVIFFTGDLVNDLHRELLPFQKTLSGLSARHGIFSILGNHDYGDYYRWENRDDKTANLKRLVNAHREMGWDILLDEHRHIEINGERITVIGVQNWSARRNFAQYGSLEKATKNITFSPVNILLSHDPSHWRAEVVGKIPEIDITFSGHTHGFQFGVEIPGFKWSPVQYVYNEWADLYSSGRQYLYVNRGLGFIGYPGRVGILPEITVMELL